MAAAALSLPCPLRRSTRLAHAHTHHQPVQQTHLKHNHHRHNPTPSTDPEPDQDSSSSDPENELTPRALRALKRQRLALDVDGLPFPTRSHRTKKRRKENIVHTTLDDARPTQVVPKAFNRHKRPSSPTPSPLASQHPHAVERTATSDAAAPSSPAIPTPESSRDSFNGATLAISSSSPQSDDILPLSTAQHELSLTSSISKENDSQEPSTQPEPSIPPSTEPSPLAPLTPSPESSPSMPGHDRQATTLPSPPHDLLPPPVSIENLPLSDTTQRNPAVLQQSPSESLPSTSLPTPSPPISLNPDLDTLIPFDGLHPPFEHELGAQINPSPSQPPPPPQLPVLDFSEQFPSFQQPQIYVPPYPDPRREANIWKLACRERVDYILKCTRKTIKELLTPESQSHTQETNGTRSQSSYLDPTGMAFNATLANTPSQTRFRLYTPASYTYSSTSWGTSSSARKTPSMDEDMDDGDAAWAMEDGDWMDGDVDMEDEDEDDYEDDEDVGAEEGLGPVEGLTIGEASTLGSSTIPPFEVDHSAMMDVGVDGRERESATKPIVIPDPPLVSRLPNLSGGSVDVPSRPMMSTHASYTLSPTVVPSQSPPLSSTPSMPPSMPPSMSLPPLTPPPTPQRLPALSSLHVPMLSEPCRSFMGRGTPPDRRRLIEWSGAGRFEMSGNGMEPSLYLTGVSQRRIEAGVGVDVDVGVTDFDGAMGMDPTVATAAAGESQGQAAHGEWTSFLYSMLEGDGVGVGVGGNMGEGGGESGDTTTHGHGSAGAWYELGLGTASGVTTGKCDVSLAGRTEQVGVGVGVGVGDDVTSSSSTLRFALG